MIEQKFEFKKKISSKNFVLIEENTNIMLKMKWEKPMISLVWRFNKTARLWMTTLVMQNVDAYFASGFSLWLRKNIRYKNFSKLNVIVF